MGSVKDKTTNSKWTNIYCLNSQVNFTHAMSKAGNPLHFARINVMSGTVIDGVDVSSKDGVPGRVSVILSEKQYENAKAEKDNDKTVRIGIGESSLERTGGKVQIEDFDKKLFDQYVADGDDRKVAAVAATKTTRVDLGKFKAAHEAARDAWFKNKGLERSGHSLKDKAAQVKSASGNLDKGETPNMTVEDKQH